jgi:hypothetical protein
MATNSKHLRALLDAQQSKHNGKAGCKSTTVYIPEWLHQFAVQDTHANSRGALSNTVVHALRLYAEAQGITAPPEEPPAPSLEDTSRDVLALAARDKTGALQLLGKLAAALTGGGDTPCFAW